MSASKSNIVSAKYYIDRSQDTGKDPVYMIGIDGGFMDYELTFEDLKNLSKEINQAIENEEGK